jgi:hypothetical protein
MAGDSKSQNEATGDAQAAAAATAKPELDMDFIDTLTGEARARALHQWVVERALDPDTQVC